MLCTLPSRLLFRDISAAAFSLFKCLSVCQATLATRSALQAVTHGFLACVWHTLYVTGVPTGRQQ